MQDTVPVIDISPLYSSFSSPEAARVAREVHDAFSTWGFFQITGHHVDVQLQKDLLQHAMQFFDLPLEQKLGLHVRKGGVAWRGYMPLGGEGTHGRVDHKEGMYFGPEHPDDHPHTGMPLHGKNQFPDVLMPEMRPTVLRYIEEMVTLGTLVCAAMSLSFGLDAQYIRDNFLLPEPVALFRAFKYSPRPDTHTNDEVWGIGEHSDFGLLTLLNHNSPGLQILSPKNEWIAVPVLDNAIVCNVGDMLDMITGGRFKSTRHRVMPPPQGTYRISFPLFFDFAWTANMVCLPLSHLEPLSAEQEAEAKQRWARGTFTSVGGQWWQYLAKKVQKVFPEMQLPDCEQNAQASSRFCIAVPT